MARKFFVGGNFKMNPTSQAQKKTIVKVLNEADLDPNVVVAPPSIYLLPLKDLLRKDIQIAAQNCYFKPSGAFTGETSPAQLVDAGIPYVILGESLSKAELGLPLTPHPPSAPFHQATPSAARSSTRPQGSSPRRRAPRSRPACA
ncbi:hypothetical protein NUW54_g14788 [Trametes sanguinea]|uniref:Uncharacterized protein n=1 Tax=Trametes sanguinea TaxID=158606 RepID=A0ACC1MB11_9APHY|nr:hypothetical protein NUW54_g14788 [Trametes sanguinea]